VSAIFVSRKQTLNPQVVDLRQLISGMSDLLTRTLPENIEIEIVGSARLWRCEIDPGQFENTLLNLAINSRDAMPEGGKLTIETSNAFLDDNFTKKHLDSTPGQYVLMAVSDSGAGMSPRVLSKAFDPFFTTKEQGKGTGLGLSMVYGFVKQSGGCLDIYSEENEGTTLKIYFPRLDADIQSVDKKNLNEVIGKGEVVLVVEDNRDLGKVVVAMLEALNYKPIFAEGVSEAIKILESIPKVDVLLTDVILTGTEKGTDLAKSVRERWPETAVLFMSGYTENAIIHNGRLDIGVELLQKPFSKKQLSVKIAQCLE